MKWKRLYTGENTKKATVTAIKFISSHVICLFNINDARLSFLKNLFDNILHSRLATV